MNLEEEQIIQIINRKDLPVKILKIINIKDIFNIPTSYNLISICGTYIIITTRGENYIGSTNDFFTRIYIHKVKGINGRTVESAYLLQTENIEDAIKLEDWLIYWIDPSLNVRGKANRQYLNDIEISLLRKDVSYGHIRRSGLYDIIKNIQIKH